MGRWGTYDLWIYSDWFVDDNNVEHPLLPDGGLIMSGPDLMGTRAFGMILDPGSTTRVCRSHPRPGWRRTRRSAFC